MALTTRFIVQSFIAAGRILRAEPPVVCRSAAVARLNAERLAAVRAGVVAYSVTSDADLGEYDETPIVIFKAGRTPPGFDE